MRCNITYTVHVCDQYGATLCFRMYQQRLPYDLLCGLANALLDGTVADIVTGLKEVQQLEERNLSGQRIKMINEHKGLRIG